MSWVLKTVGPMKWKQDDSGLYTLIHRIEEPDVHKGIAGVRIRVRIDIMSMEHSPCSSVINNDAPLQSFIGDSHDVRIAVARYLDGRVSAEHAAYIGAEITRADMIPGYVQD